MSGKCLGDTICLKAGAFLGFAGFSPARFPTTPPSSFYLVDLLATAFWFIFSQTVSWLESQTFNSHSQEVFVESQYLISKSPWAWLNVSVPVKQPTPMYPHSFISTQRLEWFSAPALLPLGAYLLFLFLLLHLCMAPCCKVTRLPPGFCTCSFSSTQLTHPFITTNSQFGSHAAFSLSGFSHLPI